MIAEQYRRLLRDRPTRRFLAGLGVSSLGDGMSTVAIAWLALLAAPAGHTGDYVGLAVAAYTLPGVLGALAFGRFLRDRPARALVLGHCLLRAGCLGTIALLGDAVSPAGYVALLAGSSLLTAWGNAGEYTMLAELGGPDGRLATNSLAGAQVSLAVIVGPLLAGAVAGWVGPVWVIAADALSFTVLGIVAWRTHTGAQAEQPVDRKAAESGFKLLRRRDLLSLTVLTWLFFFLYGPVEVALPVYVAHDLGGGARLLGVYWTAFGIGALAATLATGFLKGRDMRRITLVIVAGWGACLLPFGFAPVTVTVICFAVGGLVYGPFVPLTYALFQSATSTANLPAVLAARSSLVMLSSPLGVALGGPVVGALGAGPTLFWSGATTIALAVVGAFAWTRQTQVAALAQG
ncbi:MFS transporter [Labedaea rhizosphaerae]|uniref:Putative MFS family arabinose efflux permease n=1 Tax=Labedaea rhizosphaerae TaxID=598644 RepID=A0A4R6SJX8_LABRH|nr:MFS transporter [Labedaea rhizosphaerae]TDQ04369.1 putative MFS family arabinose efflux permease [Labedaea rhizosphaerae]